MPNPSLIIILLTVTINMMCVGLAWPILPLLVEELTGGTVSQIAVMYGATAIVFSVMQFVIAPVMGILSDRFGRKPVMLVTLAALGFDNILLALAPSMSWMFIGRLIGGSLAASSAIANAYVADVTAEKDRAKGFGLIGAAFGFGFVIGPVLGGYLGGIDLRLPFWFAAVLSFSNALIGWIFLKESLPFEKRKKRSLLASSPFAAIGWIFTTPMLSAIAVVMIISNTMQRGMESVWVIFTQHQYDWGMQQAGLSLAIVGISFIVVQGFLSGRIIPWLGEINTIIYGSALSALMFLLLAFNTWGFLGYLGIVPHVLGWALASTAMQTYASKKVSASEQGYLQGAISAISGLGAIIGPLLSNASFAWFTSQTSPINFPGAFFILGALMLFATAYLASKMR